MPHLKYLWAKNSTLNYTKLTTSKYPVWTEAITNEWIRLLDPKIKCFLYTKRENEPTDALEWLKIKKQ